MYHKSRKYNLKLINHVINDQGAFSIAYQRLYIGQCPRGYSLIHYSRLHIIQCEKY